jgi:hypothetical protein
MFGSLAERISVLASVHFLFSLSLCSSSIQLFIWRFKLIYFVYLFSSSIHFFRLNFSSFSNITITVFSTLFFRFHCLQKLFSRWKRIPLWWLRLPPYLLETAILAPASAPLLKHEDCWAHISIPSLNYLDDLKAEKKFKCFLYLYNIYSMHSCLP